MTNIVKREEPVQTAAMHDRSTPPPAAARDRPRTAVRRAGRETSARIVEAAYDLLRTGGLAEFSMRGIAKKAGVRLASVQYYFPAMEDLLPAVIALNARKYTAEYERVVRGNESPRARLEAVFAFNLEDIQTSDTRRFFLNLWPLLEQYDGFSGTLLADLYAPQFKLLGGLIRAVHPTLDEAEAGHRAKLVAAFIEGVFLTLPRTADASPDFAYLQARALSLCMAIADGSG